MSEAIRTKTIWKYPVVFAMLGVELPMPEGAEILCLQLQGGEPQLWALVDPVAPTVLRRFEIVGTGLPLPPNCTTYIGTFQIGPFVWHVWEETIV